MKMNATYKHIYTSEHSLNYSVYFNSVDYFCFLCLQTLIKLSYMRIHVHKKLNKFIYESRKMKFGIAYQLGNGVSIDKTNQNIHLTEVTSATSYPYPLFSCLILLAHPAL